MQFNFKKYLIGPVFCSLVLLCGTDVRAQNSIFTYQGKLTDNNAAANGNYTMRFELFNTASGGTNIGSPYEIAAVPVVTGVFTVNLDFDTNSFDGSPRYLQINIFSPSARA